jgi:hypothetical protein
MEVAAVNSLLGSALIGIFLACALIGVVSGVTGGFIFRRLNRIWISGLAGGVAALALSVLATYSLVYSLSYFAGESAHANRELAANLPPPQISPRPIAAFDMDEKSVRALKAIGVGEPEISLCSKVGCNVTFFRSEPAIPSPQTK